DTLAVIFRVANNDISLAYRISSPNATHCTVINEATGFDLPNHATTFITPQAPWGEGWMRTKPSYEEEYTRDEPVGTPSKYGIGYTFPALFRLGDEAWVLISETGVSSKYVGTKLSEGTTEGLYRIAFPEAEENHGMGDNTATAGLPMMTSWKTITVGTTLAPIVETTSAYDVVTPLYEPSQTYRPGRSTWSWIVWQDESINFDDQIKYIDLSAALNFEYVLVDNWWDARIGRNRIPELAQYAQKKGVALILWYNSNGAWNDAPQTPQDCMDTAPARRAEMAWLKAVGVKGIKVDFFGGDKQTTIKLYEDILTDANQYGICVNFHGATLPRGWERMYPNHMTSEAALVSENLVFNQYHTNQEAYWSTLYPFTRNAVCGMDFGGVFFNKRYTKTQQGGTERRTTIAFQLATAVIYQSATQHFAITPNNLDEQPAHVLDFMRRVPTVWDETRFVDGYPGKFIVLARRYGQHWYIAGTNAEAGTRKITLDLPHLQGRELTIITDDANGEAVVQTAKVDKKGKLTVEMKSQGGFVIFD
ncbi:glycoside hydrolase family 97 protein, partial [Bacteroides sp. OttesenSCG-928-J23]|nr:glycoside hydrolase family 97 protein [Bacteroides sp. OttesenSCG-928-J23]